MDNGERWKLIHDGYYEVSSLGNLRRAKAGHSTFVGRPVVPIVSAGGYMQVCLSGKTSRRVYVHQIAAEAFLGPRPDGYVINHKDANKTNNQITNLEYVTRSENARHAVKHIQRRKGPTKPKKEKVGPQTGCLHWTKRTPEKIARGDKMPHSKLTPELVILAKQRVKNGEMQKTVALDLGVSVAQMSRIIRGIRWTYL